MSQFIDRVHRLQRRTTTQDGPSIAKRQLSNGAIAGTVIGTVFGAVLVAFCLYPVVLFYIKRNRKNQRRKAAAADIETCNVVVNESSIDAPPRLSSSDSLKNEGEISRGNFDAAENDTVGPIQSFTRYNSGMSSHFGSEFGEEYRPQEIEDDQPGVLKGTSEDYYRPSIPSEAFGMVDQPEKSEIAPKSPTPSRVSSMSRNVRHMFRRTNSRDQTSTYRTSQDGSASSDLQLQRSGTKEELLAQSSIEEPLQPLTSPQQPTVTKSISSSPSPPSGSFPRSPPQSPPGGSDARLRLSASPPRNPAPGTVNPMDIMPAITQSEQWHRTEHELFATSHESDQGQLALAEEMQHQQQPIISPAQSPLSIDQTVEEFSPKPTIQPLLSLENDQDFVAQGQITMDDLVMHDIMSDNHLSIMAATNGARHPSYPSEQSTPLPGPAFTDVSSQPTPSTQTDTPSPESLTSSDFRHSASPLPGQTGVPSPRAHLFRCDEPGCDQSFDQPHKLKHHQRYHSKDHKCVYPGCGKGFGTKTHLRRHVNDRHEKKNKFHCSVSGCDYSRSGGKAFPRKDNWKRHMMKIHQMDQQQLPEPIEVDVEMAES